MKEEARTQLGRTLIHIGDVAVMQEVSREIKEAGRRLRVLQGAHFLDLGCEGGPKGVLGSANVGLKVFSKVLRNWL